jgi:hypothetical protein
MILVKRVLKYEILFHSVGQEIADGKEEKYKIGR